MKILNDIDQSISLLTSGNAALQDISTVASSLRVVSMRLRGTNASDLQKEGEDTEGMVENASKLRDVIKDLTKTPSNKGGIDILTDTGDYKSTYEILLEIQKVWSDLTDQKRAALLEQMAGKTRAAAVSSILSAKDSNGESLLKTAYASSVNSDGAADEAMETAMSSIENKMAVFQQSLQTMWQDSINSDFIKFLVDVGTGFVNLTDKVGLFTVALGATGIGLFIANLKNMASTSAAMQTAISAIASGTKDYSTVLSGLNKVQQMAVLQEAGLSKEQARQVVSSVAEANAIKSLSDAKAAELLVSKGMEAEKAKETIKRLASEGAIVLENGSIKVLNKTKAQSILMSQGMTEAQAAETVSSYGAATGAGVLSTALKGLVLQVQLVATSIWELMASNPVGWILGIVTVITAVTAAVIAHANSYDKLKEKLADAHEAYTDAQSDVEDLTSKIDDLNDKIKEIKSHDKLSLTDQQDLENLQAQTRELSTQLAIAKEKEALAKQEENDKAKDSLDSVFVSKYSNGGAVEHASDYVNSRQELSAAMDEIKRNQELKKEAQEKVDALLAKKEASGGELGAIDNIDLNKAEKKLDKYKSAITDASKYANELSSDLITAYQSLDMNDSESKALGEEIMNLTGSYSQLMDKINNTTTYFDTLTEAQQRASLISKMEEETNIAASDIRDFVKELDAEDLSVFYGMKMNEETSIEKLKEGMAELQAEADKNPLEIKTEMSSNASNANDVKDFITNNKVTIDGSEKTLDSVFSDYRSEISSLSDYLSKALNNTLDNDDYTSLATEFGIVSDSAEDAAVKIKDVMNASEDKTVKALDTAMSSLGDTIDSNTKNALENLRQKLIDVNKEAKNLSSGTSGYINSMADMATGFDALDKIYNDVKNGSGKNKSSSNNGAYFDFSSLTDSNFVEQFKDCGDAYQDFLKIVASSPDDLSKCQQAFNNLASAYVTQKAGLDNLIDTNGNINESLKQTTLAQLKNQGVTVDQASLDDYLAEKSKEVKINLKAEAAANELVAQRKVETKNASYDLADATIWEIKKFADEKGYAEDVTDALIKLALKKQDLNNIGLNFDGDLERIAEYVKALGGACDALNTLNAIKSGQDKSYYPPEVLAAMKQAAKSQALNALNGTKKKTTSTVTSTYTGGQTSNQERSSSGSSNKTTTTITKEYINWVQQAIDNIQSKIDRLNGKINDFTPYNKKISRLKEIYSWEQKLIDLEKKNVTTTHKRYEESLKNIPAKYRSKYKKLIEAKDASVNNYEKFVSTTTTGSGSNSSSSSSSASTAKVTSTVGQAAYNEALKYLGLKYVYGGASLTTGADCSGFTQQIYKKFGINLPHHAADQAKLGTKVSKSELQPGDLVFFGSKNNITHVGIYGGDDKFVEEPNSKSSAKVSSLSSRKNFVYGVRLSGTGATTTVSASGNNKVVDKETKTLYDTVNNASSLYKDYLAALETLAKDSTAALEAFMNECEAEIEHLQNKANIYEARISRAEQSIDSLDKNDVLKDVKTTKKSVKTIVRGDLISLLKKSTLGKLLTNGFKAGVNSLTKSIKSATKTKSTSSKTKGSAKLASVDKSYVSSNKKVKAAAEKYGMSTDSYIKLMSDNRTSTDYKTGMLLGSYQKKQYDIQVDNYNKIAKSQEDIAKVYRQEMAKLKKEGSETSEAFAKATENAVKADEAAKKASQSAKEAAKNSFLSKFNGLKASYDESAEKRQSNADRLQSKIDYNNNNGITTSTKDYKREIDVRQKDEDAAKEELDALKKQREKDQKKLDKMSKNDPNYSAAAAALDEEDKQINELTQSYYGLKQATRDAQEQALKAPLTGLQKQLDLINSQITALEKLKDKYSDSIGVVTWYLGEQIDNLQKQKDNMSDYYDALIDPLQDQLDALEKTNNQRERALALEKAKYELEKAMNQKTNKVLRNGEWVYEADQDAVRDAKSSLDDAEYNKITGELQDRIDDLTKVKNELGEAYDKEIDRIQTISDQWSKMVERAEMMSKIDVFESTYGSLQAIMQGDTSAFGKISSGIQQVQISLDSLNADKDLLQDQIDNINSLVDAFNNGSLTFKQCYKYIKSANNSLSKLKTDSENNVPSIVEATGGITTSIKKITTSSKTLSSQYSKTMKSLKTSTDGTSGVTQKLSALATSLDKVKTKLNKIDPLGGIDQKQLDSIYKDIKGTGEVFDKLSNDYLKNTNDMFGKLKDDSIPNTYTQFESIGKYIKNTFTPNVNTLSSSLKSLTTGYDNTAKKAKTASKYTSDLGSESQSFIDISASLQAANNKTASSYKTLASSAQKAADSMNAAAAAAEKKANAQSKASGSKKSSIGTAIGVGVSSIISSLFGKAHAAGTKKSDNEVALVGEASPELVWHRKEQNYQLATNPSLVKLDAGDVVFNGDETKDIMSGKHIASDINQIKGFQSKMFDGLSSVPKTTASAVPSSSETTIHVDKLELPNVRTSDDAEKIVAALCSLDGTVTQKLHSK